MDFKEFHWTRQPESFQILDNKIIVVTKPHTDLWQRTFSKRQCTGLSNGNRGKVFQLCCKN